ncbi:MAG: response regulator transcription factor [Anaerolineales bacterium]|nr:MAG: response regulator transcription factor [Anaerolineales bacterium]
MFIIWTHPLFDEAVRRLLQDWGVNIVGSTSDLLAAQEQLTTLNPSVVILEDADDPSEAEEQKTMAILNASTHVIRLNLNDNELRIYRRERRTVGKIEDLANILMRDMDTPDSVL